MVTIIFEAHGTTYDNEAHRASGWNDVDLSPLGEQQSMELGERYEGIYPDAVFVSDLKRAVRSAEIAFLDLKVPIIIDKRLRECDYGDFTQAESAVVDPEKPKRISEPFPNGESYEQTSERMKSFLKDLLRDCDGKTVMIIGHRATQYGLEHWVLNKPLKEVIPAHWSWQPGWKYELNKI